MCLPGGPHFLLSGDPYAKFHRLIKPEVTHAYRAPLVVHSALQLARWCKYQAIYAAGRLRADLAGSLGLQEKAFSQVVRLLATSRWLAHKR